MSPVYSEAASSTDLYRQAYETAEGYLVKAQRRIDKVFGEGYAANNPALVAAFMQVCATEMGTALSGKVMGAALREIANSLDEIAGALRDS
ncbi:hypothetical protein QTH91_20725 [Variovorax dokdonensis]|uniref:Uncharacterized protein n=1 Tax=Variovorax dokdonensis TaxID=344883 RepID=A0ABT7NG83_9BURK|nr:hypothetical protein [Variovorax dokdonensis]MDM0046928.1 hypothetical protein [Variovorax dokdonensis]